MGIWEAFKDVFSAVQKADNIEITNKVIALQTEVMAVYEENRALRAKQSELEAAVHLKARMQFEKDAYWMGEGRTENDGPYCSRCYDVDAKSVRMVQRYDHYFKCTQCETAVRIPGIKPPREGPSNNIDIIRT